MSTPPANPPRRRVLFVAEAVTLAHVARPVTLAKSLDPARFDIHLAWDDRYSKLFPDLPFTTHAIRSIPTAQFTNALAKGKPIYRIAELRDYVEQDLKLIAQVKPDLIVGDFRLSLAISAPVAGVKYAALANAYWSPYAKTDYPMPDHPMNAIVGRGIGKVIFNLVRPFVFARYAAPVNRLRVERGLPSLGSDLRRVYTHGDATLYADLPEMAQVENLPANHHFIGPVLWSPRVDPPAWWDKLPRDKMDRPIVYVNLGSSGNAGLLPAILESLAPLDVTVLAATAGNAAPASPPKNAFISDYLPGDLCCERAALVICNGGSPATQQALAAGKPVIGVPTNLDQCLNMQAVTRLDAGETVRTSRRLGADLRVATERLLNSAKAAQAAQKIRQLIAACDSAGRFVQALDTM